MLNQLKHKYQLLLVDSAIIAIVPFIALFILAEGRLAPRHVEMLKFYTPYTVMLHLAVFHLYGLYQRIWRYATIGDLFAIVGAVSVSSVLVLLGGIYTNSALPKNIYIINWVFMICGIGFSRLLFKIVKINLANAEANACHLLIVGAGDAGAMLAREIRQHTDGKNYKIIGYIDDDATKRGSQLFGATVLGSCDDIEEIVKRETIDEIIIAIPSAEGHIVKRIAQICKRTTCRVKIVPGLYELIEGKATMNQLRDISLEDLLRRDAIQLDMNKISGYINNKRVLVTGAGGSIGSELCRQISKIGAKQIVLLGRGENSIYEIHQELRRKFPQRDYVTAIVDIRDKQRLMETFQRYQPEIVFHAAAHKHVPLMEMQPVEAVKNNIFGTKNVAEVASAFGCERFIMISTDKAVNPTNVMGATKRVAELIVQQFNDKNTTKYNAVRFGNVLGSRGSVVPLFERQISSGGPITITHPDITRYFMTIPEAVQLVLQSGALANGGEIFLLDMGEPIKILDMAKDLIELHGLEPDDIPIAFTGLRPGEKLYEELLTAEEGSMSTKHHKIFSAKIQPVDQLLLRQCLQTLSRTSDAQTILHTLRELVPTYQSAMLKEKDEGEKVS